MKVSVKWLKDYLDLNIPAAELAHRLNMSGNEVKAVINLGGSWDNVVVGQVVAINPHPNADKLRLATVETGRGQETVVCGAWNYKEGDKIAFASVGAVLKDGHTGQTAKLKPAKIRGVESRGMICSEMELGISEEHSGILILPADAPVGSSLSDYRGDYVIDMDVTPNRPDCLSVIGIAREASALTGLPLHIKEPAFAGGDMAVESKIAVEIQAPELCARYCASLITGIKIKPSPHWLQERLIACGMRPINNIVDISNYVMLEYGQPLHTFDYNKIAGSKIIVRKARENEIITSLDGVERKLTPEMLVICDSEKAVAVAGVMGGANSEVTEQTCNILLEAASFKATSIHATGEALGLASESRYRFERGIAPGLTVPALKRATELIVELGEGQAAQGWLDVYPGCQENRAIKLSQNKLQRLLGLEYSLDEIKNNLKSLGIECRDGSQPGEIAAFSPYWRSDINIEADLIEEVARIQGYDRIPTTLLAEPLPSLDPDPILSLKDKIRNGLVANGFAEVLNFSLVSKEILENITAEKADIAGSLLRVANPMTADMEYLRTSLRGTLLSAFADNRKYREGSIRLFELGKIYLKREKELPDERETVCAVIGGQRYDRSWQNRDEKIDFFDAKGIVESLLMRLGLEASFEKGVDGGLHPNRQAAIYLSRQCIGVLGEIHPKVALRFEISEPLYLIELDLKNMVNLASAGRGYRPVGKFPSIMRDLALVVDAGVTNQQIQKIIKGFNLVEDSEVFDVYFGGQVPSGRKSLAYHITYRSAAHTLTDEEVGRVQQQILDKLNKELGAELR